MILAESAELVTALFPERIPEASEAMTPDESASFTAFQASGTGRGLYAALAAHVVRRLDVKSGRLISVGEGEGFIARALAALLPGVQVVGTDLCPAVIERARARHVAGNLSFEVANAHDLAALGPADAVVSLNALHHFDDARRAIRAMKAVLAPGGRLYIQDLRRDATVGAYFRVLDMYVMTGQLPVASLFRASVQAAYTTAELRGLLGGGTVGQVRFDERAQAAFRAEDPEHETTLPEVLANVAGLWHEGVVS